MKHLRYLKYLLRHKWFVFVAGLRVGVPIHRLIIHDWSKFLPCEWFPYANYFYGSQPDKNEPDDYRYWSAKFKLQSAFDRAWLHHQHWNAHHWQHFILRNDDGKAGPLTMPESLAREMVADWMGAGRAITGHWAVEFWYQSNRDKIILANQTREFVENVIACYTPHRTMERI